MHSFKLNTVGSDGPHVRRYYSPSGIAKNVDSTISRYQGFVKVSMHSCAFLRNVCSLCTQVDVILLSAHEYDIIFVSTLRPPGSTFSHEFVSCIRKEYILLQPSYVRTISHYLFSHVFRGLWSVV